MEKETSHNSSSNDSVDMFTWNEVVKVDVASQYENLNIDLVKSEQTVETSDVWYKHLELKPEDDILNTAFYYDDTKEE